MNILHLEDYDPEKGQDYAEELHALLQSMNMQYTNVETLADFISLGDYARYNAIIIDGQFPASKGDKPDVKNFKKALEHLQSMNFSKNKIIVWSNSTRVHALCKDIGLVYFSKKNMEPKEYIEKNVDSNVKAMKATSIDIITRIRQFIQNGENSRKN